MTSLEVIFSFSVIIYILIVTIYKAEASLNLYQFKVIEVGF